MKKLVFLFSLLSVFCVKGFSQGSMQDSIRQVLNTMPPDTSRLEYLNREMSEGKSVEQSTQYARLLLDEAKKQKNDTYRGKAIFLMLRYCYVYQADSMQYWLEQAEPVFLKTGMIEELFRTKAWYIYAKNREGQSNEAMQLVKELKDLSVRLNFPDGCDMANQALADSYFKNSLPDEGVQLYEEVLNSMEKRRVPLAKPAYILRQLINLSGDREKRKFYLEKLNKYITLCKDSGIVRLDDQTSTYTMEYIYHRGWATICMKENNFSNALMHLNKARELTQKHPDIKYDNELLQLYGIYYYSTKNYQRAIQIYDTLVSNYTQQGRLKSLADVYEKRAVAQYAGAAYKDAADSYADMIAINDSLFKSTFYKDLADMKAQHETDKLQIKTKQMELEAAHSHVQMLGLWGGLGLLTLACCLLAYVSYSRHRYGKQLEVAKEKAEESDQMKSAFLANMNHEIRTPLNAIVGFSQIIAVEPEEEVRLEYATIIQNNNELLQRLISDVLDISKIESNAMSLNYHECDLPALMKEIYSIILLRMPPGVLLELTDCRLLQFITDRNRLTQILTNLLTNAIKHTEAGKIRFGYEVGDNQVSFFVEDSGKGIPEDQLDKIFSRFVQLSHWTKGVGLGLAICKGLVTKMGGTIGVTSQLGEGSCFTMQLPIRKTVSE